MKKIWKCCQKNNDCFVRLIKFLKPSKDKKKLFYFMILIAFLISIIDMFLTRFLIKYYYYNDSMVYGLYFFITRFLRYFLIAYLSITFIKKKCSISKEFYNIFKVVLLLYAFSVLHSTLTNFVFNKLNLFTVNWVQYALAFTSLITYYIVACYIYSFKKMIK